ncbi:MAG: type VI secretion system lipoprotein TssJ [Deltaproteobacteria bacterium]|nr:type VI secretion system lipoprotein TssJ [Deltaproteobacteria bacterium]
MKKTLVRDRWLLGLFFIFAVAIGGCAGTSTSQTSTSAAKEQGPVEEMKLAFVADRTVNWDNDKPHPIVICFYQLTSPGVITTREQRSEGISELLSCRGLDSSILSYERLTLQPGQSVLKTIRRLPTGSYIGVAAGYFNTAKCKLTTVIEMDNTAATIYLGQYGVGVKKTGEKRKMP